MCQKAILGPLGPVRLKDKDGFVVEQQQNPKQPTRRGDPAGNEENEKMMTLARWGVMTDWAKTVWLGENRPAGKMSLAKRGLVYGSGINDAGYATNPVIEGARVKCPAYVTWKDMLGRTYDPKLKARLPTYAGVTVAPEWHSFSNFRRWWVTNYREGYALDKDLLVEGNKQYGPDACLFVPGWVNNLLTDHGAARGDLPLGVSESKGRGKPYRAQLRINGKNRHLGRFHDPLTAHVVYGANKLAHVHDLADELDAVDPRLYPAIRDVVLGRFLPIPADTVETDEDAFFSRHAA